MNCLLLAALLVSLLPSSLSAGDVVREDFAYGVELLTSGEGAIHALIVPDDVYLTVRRQGLGDIRVVNAAGEVLPHAVRTPAEDDRTDRSQRKVAFFPLTAKAGGAGREDLTLVVRRSENGLIAGIATATSGGEDRQPAYLFDLGKDHFAAAAIEMRWKNPTLPLTTVSLFDSADLVHWRPVVESSVLADLEYRGNRVMKRDLALPAATGRYLKMIGRGREELPELTEVVAVSAGPAADRGKRWVALRPDGIEREGSVIVVDYRGDYRLPTDGVRLGFAETNSMIRAAVQSRPDSRSPWITRCTGVFYSLRVEGAEIASNTCSFAATADSWWRLQILEDGAGIEGQERAPTLELGWKPAELLFVVRGAGPYMLLYGSGRVAGSGEAHDSHMLLDAVNGGDKPPVRSAAVGGRVELGGVKALQIPPQPLPWRRWLLWAVLAVGIALLAAMVRHLWLDMRRPQ